MLTELDKEYLRRIADEDGMIDALRKYILNDYFMNAIVDQSHTDTNEIIGQKYRAYNSAKDLVSKALDNLSVYKGRKISKEKEIRLER